MPLLPCWFPATVELPFSFSDSRLDHYPVQWFFLCIEPRDLVVLFARGGLEPRERLGLLFRPIVLCDQSGFDWVFLI